MIYTRCKKCNSMMYDFEVNTHECGVKGYEWPKIEPAEDEKDKQIAELKAENERLRIALMELERLAREALGG